MNFFYYSINKEKKKKNKRIVGWMYERHLATAHPAKPTRGRGVVGQKPTNECKCKRHNQPASQPTSSASEDATSDQPASLNRDQEVERLTQALAASEKKRRSAQAEATTEQTKRAEVQNELDAKIAAHKQEVFALKARIPDMDKLP